MVTGLTVSVPDSVTKEVLSLQPFPPLVLLFSCCRCCHSLFLLLLTLGLLFRDPFLVALPFTTEPFVWGFSAFAAASASRFY